MPLSVYVSPRSVDDEFFVVVYDMAVGGCFVVLLHYLKVCDARV